MSETNEWNKKIIKEFRENDGKVGGYFESTPLLLLHTIGAKSGLPHLNPVAYLADGEQFVIVASKAGAPTNPDWYHNIIANPKVSVEIGTEQFQARATVTSEPERTQLFEKMVAVNPGFAEYQRKTDRVIPVIRLTRLS